MSELIATQSPQVITMFSDLWTLTKPRLSMLVIITAGGGYWLSGATDVVAGLLAVGGTTLVVAAANACAATAAAASTAPRVAADAAVAANETVAWDVVAGGAFARDTARVHGRLLLPRHPYKEARLGERVCGRSHTPCAEHSVRRARRSLRW